MRPQPLEQSVWFSLFKGRIALIEHDLERAKDNFESCVLLKNRLDIKQLTILYHWELIWCYAYVYFNSNLIIIIIQISFNLNFI